VSVIKKLRPALNWVAEGFANLNELVDWAIVPIIVLFKWLFRLLKKTPGFKHSPREI
jgi:hypothetical protein